MNLSSLTSARGRNVAFVACALLTIGLGGCATEQQVYQAADTTKYTLENTDRFAALDRATQQAISCTGLQYRALADGRLEVTANLKNREARKIEIQTSCVFRDDQAVVVLEETPWKTITVAENATQAVRFSASSTAAKKYTVRVRQAR